MLRVWSAQTGEFVRPLEFAFSPSYIDGQGVARTIDPLTPASHRVTGTLIEAGKGTPDARVGCMISNFRDLVAWQLCHTLKCEVFEFTEIGPASRDFKYRDQIRDSSASAPRNIAEGFKRFGRRRGFRTSPTPRPTSRKSCCFPSSGRFVDERAEVGRRQLTAPQ